MGQVTIIPSMAGQSWGTKVLGPDGELVPDVRKITVIFEPGQSVVASIEVIAPYVTPVVAEASITEVCSHCGAQKRRSEPDADGPPPADEPENDPGTR